MSYLFISAASDTIYDVGEDTFINRHSFLWAESIVSIVIVDKFTATRVLPISSSFDRLLGEAELFHRKVYKTRNIVRDVELDTRIYRDIALEKSAKRDNVQFVSATVETSCVTQNRTHVKIVTAYPRV